MHGTLNRERTVDLEPVAFAAVEATSHAPTARSAYGVDRRLSLPTIASILLGHVALLYALVTFDVIHIAEKKPPLVVELIAEAPPPPVEKEKPEPVEVQKVVPQIVAPAPIIQTIAPPPPIAVSFTPPPPQPVPAPAPPAGPVMVGNLDERLIEGRPPRYPLESRRKHEVGTVLLRLLIGTDGRVQQISIAQSSGFTRLDQAAMDAARHWRWQPMVRDGAAVEVRGTLAFPFVLNG